MRTLPSLYHELQIDTQAIINNFQWLRSLLPPGMKAAAIIKADAYGHGARYLAPRLQAAGADALAITKVSEGLTLRQDGITLPLWLLLGAMPHEAPAIAHSQLWPATDNLDLLRALSDAAHHEQKVNCLIKVDTGMNRLGLAPDDVMEFLSQAAKLPGLNLTGLVSHLAHGGVVGAQASERQTREFNALLNAVRAAGWPMLDSSLLNSGGSMLPPPEALQAAGWVRLGVALYGGLPDLGLAGASRLKPAMFFKSRIIAVHQAKAGSQVSYGGTYTLPRDALLATVPVGYAEGYPRSLSNQGYMLINGQMAPIRGRVCMNMTMVEVEHINPLPQVGDPVVLLGRQAEQAITIDDLAGWAQTISYEIMCSLGAALPHRYL